MGMHMSLVMIRADGSEFIESDPRYKAVNAVEERSRFYARGEVLFSKYASQDFMFSDPHVCPWYGRGLPDWLNAEQRQAMDEGCSPTWLTIDELLAVDWDAPLRPWPDPNWLVPQLGSRRDKLGEEFIEWTRTLQRNGVVLIAVSAS